MRWAYGITTVPTRRDTFFSDTLVSLAIAGFEKPRIFCDGDQPRAYPARLDVTVRSPAIRTHGNWVLGLLELYIRNPDCDRYAMFQDDVQSVKGLREYLEGCPYPDKGFLNLYTHPGNYHLSEGKQGWYLSNQRGKGAQGYVFSHEALRTLMLAEHMLRRPENTQQMGSGGWLRGQKNLDGGVGDSFRKAGWQEWVHRPSLLQHTGEKQSAMFNTAGHIAVDFPGEEFDARTLLGGRDVPLEPCK